MTPAARVQTAIELLGPILEGAPAEKVLTQWARKSRFAGSKDRAAIRDHVFDVLRRKNSVAHCGGGQNPRALMIGLLRRQGLELSDLHEIFSGAPYAPEVLSEDEMVLDPCAEQVDLPEWIIPDAELSLGGDYSAIEALLKERAPVILRVNLRKSTRAKAQASLLSEAIETKDHPASGTALVVIEGARKIRNSKAYRDGHVELQDAASQAAIDLLAAAKSGDTLGRVLDYCAGGGGKLLAMAGQYSGQYFAHDANASRLRDLPERCKRAGVKAKVLSTGDVEHQAPFDLVFCDVPCSGSGTWRRDPDGKWKITRETLDNTLKIQREILLSASKYARDGGYLAYATCSLLQSENEEQIRGFLNENPTWTVEYQHRWSPLDGCDGFFTALLKKPA